MECENGLREPCAEALCPGEILGYAHAREPESRNRAMATLTKSELDRLDADGYLALPGIVEPKRLKAMRTRLEELIAVTKQDHAGTLIVPGLLDEEVFDAAWSHPRIDAAVRHLLGDECRLTGVALRGIRPGHGQQALHVDWGGQGVPGVSYGCHAICAFVDFTPENGSTRVIPGSHRNPWILQGRFDPRKPHPLQRQLLGAAGTVFILNIHCFHSAVHNASDEPRLAIFTCYARRDSPILLNEPPPDPSPKTLARHSPEVQALLVGDSRQP
jgi:hypothetical protein